MGAFDDLIPKKGSKAPQRNAGGAFADLVPLAAFGDVQSSIDSTEDRSGGYKGPLLAPSKFAEVNAPSLQEINAANRAYMASPQMDADQAAFDKSQAAAKKRAFKELPIPARALIGAGARVGSWGRGANQLYATAADYIDPLAPTMSGLITGDQPSRLAAAQKAEAEARAQDAYMDGDLAASAGGIGADVISAAIPLSRAGQLGTLARYGTSAAAGAGMGALAPTVEGESRLLNTGLGFGLGLAGQGASDALGKIGQAAAPEVRALYEAAKKRGIQITPAELSNSETFKRVAAFLGRQPFGGASSRMASREQAFNREAAKTIGQDADVIDQQLMAQAYGDFGKRYDALFEGGGAYDRQFLKDVAQIKREAAQGMDDSAQRTIGNLTQRVRKQASGGEIQGKTLQSLDEQAERAATGGGDRQAVAERFREALRDNMERTSSRADEWRELNRQYASYKTLEGIVADNPVGGIPSQRLVGAVNRTGKGKARMARGQAGDLGELATIASRLRQPRTSGTPEGLQAAEWGNPLLWPLIGARAGLGATVGRGLNSGLLADYLMSAGRGQGANLLAPYMRPASIGLLPYLQDSEDPRDRP